ncbi:hypothetical protein E2C01_013226 [Portunus trituberculatus]|uniref:Uncharacterized protein n=1 Tax=Portunus trituberculatus TaxID=210409 RepID=A0A5B7DGI7_PORTR|nr:hypothetical protein [Portunus trituberculatus]
MRAESHQHTDSPSMREWLMVPPMQYAKRKTHSQDRSFTTKRDSNWKLTRPSTHHFKLESLPNSSLISGTVKRIFINLCSFK